MCSLLTWDALDELRLHSVTGKPGEDMRKDENGGTQIVAKCYDNIFKSGKVSLFADPHVLWGFFPPVK